MDITNMKKGICTLKLENLKKVYNSDGQVDDSLLNAVFSIIDFNMSGNKQIVSKEVCLNSAYTLKFKPLLCQYLEATDYDNPNDDFGTHGEFEGKLRNGEDYLFTNTHAIGVSEKEGYLGIVKDEKGNDIDVLLASFMLWVYRYPNEISLINEFYNKGEPLYTSCEYYYTSSEIKEDENGNKYEEITGQILFDGHCCLGKNIPPAYNSSKLISFNTKWNKAINELSQKQFNSNQNQLNTDIDKNKNINKKEDDRMAEEMFKKVCELSFDDIYSLIYGQLKSTLSEKEYDNSWINEIYESYFILSYWNDNEHKYFKVGYTKANEAVTIDWENRKEVYLYQEWKEIPEVQSSLNELNTKITEKDTTITSLNEKITTLTSEKDEVSNKLTEAANSITELSKQVNEMKPIVEKFNDEKYNESLNEQKVKYEEKFIALNAKDKFESEEVQNLIVKSLNSDSEGKEAVLSLNSMLVDLVKPVEKKESAIHSEPTKSLNDLIKTKDDFEKRYFV